MTGQNYKAPGLTVKKIKRGRNGAGFGCFAFRPFCQGVGLKPKPSRCLRCLSRIVYLGYLNRIQVSPEIHLGKPCVAGTRIPVQAVLELVREAIPFDSIIRDYYPDLTMEDIQACVQYAIDLVQAENIHYSYRRPFVRFLLDQDVCAVTRSLLCDLGHDVVTGPSVDSPPQST
jgi:uncharacterized protein (DUF433 family)